MLLEFSRLISTLAYRFAFLNIRLEYVRGTVTLLFAVCDIDSYRVLIGYNSISFVPSKLFCRNKGSSGQVKGFSAAWKMPGISFDYLENLQSLFHVAILIFNMKVFSEHSFTYKSTLMCIT